LQFHSESDIGPDFALQCQSYRIFPNIKEFGAFNHYNQFNVLRWQMAPNITVRHRFIARNLHLAVSDNCPKIANARKNATSRNQYQSILLDYPTWIEAG
jgi:hypothetical protein